MDPKRGIQGHWYRDMVTPDALHLHVGGYCCQGSLSPVTQGAAYHPPAALLYILRDLLTDGEHQAPNEDVA